VELAVPADMKLRMLALWRHHGDHIRSEVRRDMTLVKALHVLLPPYNGPGVTLYRGDSAWHCLRRTYGLSWSASLDVADSFAAGCLWRSSKGGSVVQYRRLRRMQFSFRPQLALPDHAHQFSL
jgi:hypothetical protein